jgi:hypothetical protein
MNPIVAQNVTLADGGSGTVYRPLFGTGAYASIFIGQPAPITKVSEDGVETVEQQPRFCVFEYANPRKVSQVRPLRAFRKKNVHKGDLILSADGTQQFKGNELFVIEEYVEVWETESAPIKDQATIDNIEKTLKAFVIA